MIGSIIDKLCGPVNTMGAATVDPTDVSNDSVLFNEITEATTRGLAYPSCEVSVATAVTLLTGLIQVSPVSTKLVTFPTIHGAHSLSIFTKQMRLWTIAP